MSLNFRQTYIEAHQAHHSDGGIPIRQQKALDACCKIDEASHPHLWGMLEHAVAHRYEKATGQKIDSSFDWSTIKQWLIDHWPQIVSMLCSIISLFLMFASDEEGVENDAFGGLLPDFGPVIIKAQETMKNADDTLTKVDGAIDDIKGKFDALWARVFPTMS